VVDVEFTREFRSAFFKIKDKFLKDKVIKQIEKIKHNPEIGKPMRNVRKGTREVYIKPNRLSYSYIIKDNVVYILDLYHKKKQ